MPICRAQQRRPPRRKACEGCCAAKARCDLTPEGCSRCALKGIECRYPSIREVGAAHTPRSSRPVGDVSSVVRRTRLESSIGDADVDFGAFIVDSPDVMPQSSVSIPWDEGSDPISFPIPLELGALDLPEGLSTDIVLAPIVPPWTAGHFLESRFTTPASVDGTVSRARQPSLTESIVTLTLRSYPMMMQPGGLPPFIHSEHIRHADMRSILANCLSLMVLWRAQRSVNQDFVKECVERERDKLFREVWANPDACLNACLNACLKCMSECMCEEGGLRPFAV
jgi:hypothetical protein